MAYYKKLIGERIYLSPRGDSPEEVEKFTKWLSDSEVTDYISFSASLVIPSHEKEFLYSSAKNDKERSFTIVDINNDNPIGTVSLENINWVNKNAVLGIFIGEENYRNGGFGTEAIKLILDYGFNYLNLHSIRLELLDTNERAHKCYKKCGFVDTGKHRDKTFINGKYHDILQMDILRDEFKESCIKNKVVQ